CLRPRQGRDAGHRGAIAAGLVASPHARVDCRAPHPQFRWRRRAGGVAGRVEGRGMKISQRLFLAVVPAILGVLSVAGLAYWGEFHRAAPEWVVVIAAVSALGSLVLAWQNTRYVARRIERLAGSSERRPTPSRSPLSMVRSAALPEADVAPDELDSIEEV